MWQQTGSAINALKAVLLVGMVPSLASKFRFFSEVNSLGTFTCRLLRRKKCKVVRLDRTILLLIYEFAKAIIRSKTQCRDDRKNTDKTAAQTTAALEAADPS